MASRWQTREHLAAVRSATDWYFIDRTGATVLGPLRSAGNFCEGLAYVDSEDARGYIDKRGDLVIELPEGLTCEDWPEKGFSEGLAAVVLLEQYPGVNDFETYGYVDKNGAVIWQGG